MMPGAGPIPAAAAGPDKIGETVRADQTSGRSRIGLRGMGPNVAGLGTSRRPWRPAAAPAAG